MKGVFGGNNIFGDNFQPSKLGNKRPEFDYMYVNIEVWEGRLV
jgi:hypothetical protein